MKLFVLPPYRFRCDDVLLRMCGDMFHYIPVNPVLPPLFDDTPNEQRSQRSAAWWDVPFIRTYHSTDAKFIRYWSGGVRYDVRCLDGGCWDRSTVWGMYSTLQDAVTSIVTRKS